MSGVRKAVRKANKRRRTTGGSRRTPARFTHVDEHGAARMVDVSGKQETAREAVAGARVKMHAATFRMIAGRSAVKGDVLGIARVAGIMAAKQTADLIPLCHPLQLSSVAVDFTPDRKSSSIAITAQVRTTGRTGAEMEALAAVAVAGLTIYDMCKAVDRSMSVTDIRLLKKSGGKSGTYVRK